MSNIIEQERHGLWIAASVIIGIVAVVMALLAFNRANAALVGLQAEILILNKKVEDMRRTLPPPAAQPAAPTAAKSDAPKQ